MTGPTWIYELGAEKARELRVAVGLDQQGAAPLSSIFAYAIVPGIARALTHPALALRRADLRPTRLDITWHGYPRVGDELDCSIEVDPAGRGRISVERDGSSIVDVLLVLTEEGSSLPAMQGRALGERTVLDSARAMAFAAATWDLNPAYYSSEFAVAAGLGATVVPPGLAPALVLEMIRRSSGEPLTAATLHLGATPRTGDELMVRLAFGGSHVELIAEVAGKPVCWGSCS